MHRVLMIPCRVGRAAVVMIAHGSNLAPVRASPVVLTVRLMFGRFVCPIGCPPDR